MRWNLPNILTWLRIVAIPLIVGVFYLGLGQKLQNLIATVMFVVFALTDWLDGYLARRLNQISAFGAFLDPVADKLMVATALVLLVGHDTRPLIVLTAIVIGFGVQAFAGTYVSDEAEVTLAVEVAPDGGLLLTDDLSLAGLSNAPVAALSFIAGYGYLRFFADGDPSQGPDHLNFALSGDQQLFHRILLSQSRDDGESWSLAVPTDLPNPNASVEVLALRCF